MYLICILNLLFQSIIDFMNIVSLRYSFNNQNHLFIIGIGFAFDNIFGDYVLMLSCMARLLFQKIILNELCRLTWTGGLSRDEFRTLSNINNWTFLGNYSYRLKTIHYFYQKLHHSYLLGPRYTSVDDFRSGRRFKFNGLNFLQFHLSLMSNVQRK